MPAALKNIAEGSSACAVKALDIPMAFVPCSKIPKPAACSGATADSNSPASPSPKNSLFFSVIELDLLAV